MAKTTATPAEKPEAKRIYVVEEVDGEGEIVKNHLINARTPSQAIGHAVRGKFSAHVCSVSEMREFKDLPVLEAGAE